MCFGEKIPERPYANTNRAKLGILLLDGADRGLRWHGVSPLIFRTRGVHGWSPGTRTAVLVDEKLGADRELIKTEKGETISLRSLLVKGNVLYLGERE